MNLAHFLFSPITFMSFVEKTKISDKPLFTAPYLNIRYLHVSLWDKSVQNLYARTVSQIYQPCDLPFHHQLFLPPSLYMQHDFT